MGGANDEVKAPAEEVKESAPKARRAFFHADIEGYSVALRHALTIIVIPILAVCVFCTVNIVLHYDLGFTRLLIYIIAGAVLFGMIFVFSAVYIVEKKKRRHARFTFFDILPQGMVFSEYAGEFVRYGERIILRRLYYVSFADFEGVSRDPKKTPRELTIKGDVRAYFQEDSRLGYHVDENGNVVFDSVILNLGMYEHIDGFTIKKRFGNTKALENSILFYKDRFDNMPEKKPFDISEFVPVRRKRKARTSNPALEAPSFSRNWK